MKETSRIIDSLVSKASSAEINGGPTSGQQSKNSSTRYLPRYAGGGGSWNKSRENGEGIQSSSPMFGMNLSNISKMRQVLDRAIATDGPSKGEKSIRRS
jgi:hypothetical protein